MDGKATHGPGSFNSHGETQFRFAQDPWTGCLRTGAVAGGMYRTRGLHFTDSNYEAGSGADHFFVYGEPGVDHRRREHHTELEHARRDERDHRARELCFDFRNRFGGAESDGHYHVHADGHEQHRVGDRAGECDGDPAEPTDNHLFHGEPDRHRFGRDQHAELDDVGRGDAYDHAGNVCVDLSERHDEREPGGHNDLRADGDQCRRIGDGNGDCDRADNDAAVDHLVHGKPGEHSNGIKQHAELGDDGRDGHRDYAGDVYIDVRERHDISEPDGDDDIYADGDQRGRLKHRDGEGDSERGWAAEDYDDKLPRRDTRDSLCGLHDWRERGDAALHILSQQQRQLSSAA